MNHDACARQHRRLPLALGCCRIDHYGSRISYRNAAEDSVAVALKANQNWRRFPFAGTVREQASKPFRFENAAKSRRKTSPFRSKRQPSIGAGMKRAMKTAVWKVLTRATRTGTPLLHLRPAKYICPLEGGTLYGTDEQRRPRSWNQAGAVVSSLVQRNSVRSLHIRCMMTARRRAKATIALRRPPRLAMFVAQAFSQDHPSHG